MIINKIHSLRKAIRYQNVLFSKTPNFFCLCHKPGILFSQNKKNNDNQNPSHQGFEKFQRVRKNVSELKKTEVKNSDIQKNSDEIPKKNSFQASKSKLDDVINKEQTETPKGFSKFVRNMKNMSEELPKTQEKQSDSKNNLDTTKMEDLRAAKKSDEIEKNEEEPKEIKETKVKIESKQQLSKGFEKFQNKNKSIDEKNHHNINSARNEFLNNSEKNKEIKEKEEEDLKKKINPDVLKTIEKLKNDSDKQTNDKQNLSNQEKTENQTEDKNAKSKNKQNYDDIDENQEKTNKFKKDQEKLKKEQEEKEDNYTKKFTTIFEFFLQNFRVFILGSVFLVGGGIIYKIIDNYNVITFSDLVYNYIANSKVQSISIKRMNNGSNYSTYAQITLTNNETKKIYLSNSSHFIQNLESIQLEMGRQPAQHVPVKFEYFIDRSSVLANAFEIALALAGIVYIYSFLKTRGGGLADKTNDILGIGKSNVKVFGIDNNVKVRFKDVAGLNEAKLEISEFVDFLKRPRKYKELGARLPRGALLSGPPGTGKTMLAKACAGEAGVPFLYISGSDFVEMFVGVGAARVRDLFKQAKSKAPSMIFIDEIDAVGRKRDSKFGGNDERDNTLNQLLVEMDGFGTDSQVVVIAATNRKELLDPALTRPGRFDRTIEVTEPDLDERKSIFLVHLKPLKLNIEKKIEEYARRLATLTPGFTGADISNLCNEAGLIAARKNKESIDSFDFESASERVIAGLEKRKMLSEEERRVVAYHESGHAVVSWFLQGGSPLLKLTIVPRSKGSLGFAQYLPNETSLESQEELLDRICCILGGRCSEEFFFKKVSTGASDDIQKAFQIAYSLVTKFGMSEKIGFMGLPDENYYKKVSENTQSIIDSEVKKIIENCEKITKETIEKYKTQIEELAKCLLDKETLDLNSIIKILGDRPFPPRSNFKEYLETKQIIEKENEEKKKNDSSENTHVEQGQLNQYKI